MSILSWNQETSTRSTCILDGIEFVIVKSPDGRFHVQVRNTMGVIVHYSTGFVSEVAAAVYADGFAKEIESEHQIDELERLGFAALERWNAVGCPWEPPIMHSDFEIVEFDGD